MIASLFYFLLPYSSSLILTSMKKSLAPYFKALHYENLLPFRFNVGRNAVPRYVLVSAKFILSMSKYSVLRVGFF